MCDPSFLTGKSADFDSPVQRPNSTQAFNPAQIDQGIDRLGAIFQPTVGVLTPADQPASVRQAISNLKRVFDLYRLVQFHIWHYVM